MGKAANFKFCTHIRRIDRNKSPLKISRKVAVGVLRDSREFSGWTPIHRAHRTVIFAVAQLSRICPALLILVDVKFVELITVTCTPYG